MTDPTTSLRIPASVRYICLIWRLTWANSNDKCPQLSLYKWQMLKGRRVVLAITFITLKGHWLDNFINPWICIHKSYNCYTFRRVCIQQRYGRPYYYTVNCTVTYTDATANLLKYLRGYSTVTVKLLHRRSAVTSM